MRKIVTGLFVSLDGVVDVHLDWQTPYFDEELFESIAATWDRADAVLVGRRSFEGYLAMRSEFPDSPMVGFLERVDRLVVTTTLTETTWSGTTMLRDDVPGRLALLKQAPGKDILVPHSPTLVRWLLRNGLCDELNLIILPIIIGHGSRLFPDTTDHPVRTRLDIVHAKTLRSGVVELSYTPTLREEKPPLG
jgi:dihydrofolate reductase